MHPEPQIRVQLGFASSHEGDLERVKQMTHDQVIADLGDRRTSGVEWRFWPATQAFEIWNAFGIEITQELRDIVAAYPNGTVVVASAQGLPESGGD